MPWTEPSDEQLVNFVAVRVYGVATPESVKELVRHALSVPSVKETWLRNHREFQQMADELHEGGPSGDHHGGD